MSAANEIVKRRARRKLTKNKLRQPHINQPRIYSRGDVVGPNTILSYEGVWDSQTPGCPADTIYKVRCKCGNVRLMPSRNVGNKHACTECAREATRGERVERLCKWCGRGDAKFIPGWATTCSACSRSATRHRRFPCGKPKRKGPLTLVPENEHQCDQCEPWVLSARVKWLLSLDPPS